MKKTILIIITVLLLFSYTACNQSDIGIFYGIEKEEKIVDNSLPNTLTVGGMGKLGTTLFVAAGKVYKKTSGSSEEWVKCTSPSGYDLSTSLAVLGTDVYAVWFNKDTADKALYSTTDGSSWTPVTFSHSGSIENIDSANGVMAVATRTDSNTGNIYTTLNGSLYTQLAGVNALGAIVEIEYDGTDHWLLTQEQIIKDPLGLKTIEKTATEYDNYFRKIYAYNETHVYVSYNDRNIYIYNGASWSEDDDEVGSIAVNVNGMVVFDFEGDDQFLVGTDSYGYYETENLSDLSDLDYPDSDSITCDYTTYTASDLKQESAILDFFADGTELYALTTKGLWKNSVDDGEREWNWE